MHQSLMNDFSELDTMMKCIYNMTRISFSCRGQCSWILSAVIKEKLKKLRLHYLIEEVEEVKIE